jgi:hypothetical protein
MAIKVGVSGVTTQTVAVAGSTTQVKKIVVGTPVRRVRTSAEDASLTGLSDVVNTNLQNGSVLVYSASSSKWVATNDLDDQAMDGGSY